MKTYPPQDPALGALEGKITFEGEVPELKPFEIPAAHQDHAACVSHVKNESLVLSEKKDIMNVLISVAGYQPAEKVKPRKAHLDNKRCAFVPHLQATTVGSTLEITNSDAFLHNTHAVLALSFNVAIPPGGKEEKPIKKAGRAVVSCSFHTWMQANIWVFSHDLFDTTGPDGAFKIPNIPPGEYQIDVWHESLAPVAQKHKVKIEAGKTARLDLALRPREKK
ncbi:MAG TPA: carboxypeptidase regulatory-like domain-containing protein [Planctomycetota bacterium]|nr:carboxypeptidase regulatory-like domain-containing protein [Planctomycetota bacterium]